jgi:hypothetical protein
MTREFSADELNQFLGEGGTKMADVPSVRDVHSRRVIDETWLGDEDEGEIIFATTMHEGYPREVIVYVPIPTNEETGRTAIDVSFYVSEDDWEGMKSRFGLERQPSAWDEFVDYMEMTYGTRSPLCDWCKKPVWLSLQGFYGGGMWTTDKEHEGPVSASLGGPGTEPGTVCSESQDPEDHGHQVLSNH